MNDRDKIRVFYGHLLNGKKQEIDINRLISQGVASIRRVMRPWSDTKITHYTIMQAGHTPLYVRQIERNDEIWFEEVSESEQV